jgi:hypothetical protein
MENNGRVTMAMRISKQPSTIRIIIDEKQPEIMEYCYYRGADRSLARPGRKQATVTEDFDFRIAYL